jgi:hypothetical protein
MPRSVRSRSTGTQTEPAPMTSLRTANYVVSRANNSLRAGIAAVTSRMETGRLKVLRTCSNLIAEAGLYRYPPRPSGTLTRVQEPPYFGLKYRKVVGKADARFVLLALFGRERPIVAFLGQLVDPRLYLRVGPELHQRASHLGRKRLDDRFHQPIEDRRGLSHGVSIPERSRRRSWQNRPVQGSYITNSLRCHLSSVNRHNSSAPPKRYLRLSLR